LPGERSIRIATGLILFAYAACHFLSHATGVFLLDHMEALGRGILLAPWRTLHRRIKRRHKRRVLRLGRGGRFVLGG
jgi:hypothetical protein